MKNLFLAFALILGIGVGAAASQSPYLFTITPFNNETLDSEALECVKTNGEGALIFDLTLTDDGKSYTATPQGYACVKEVVNK